MKKELRKLEEEYKKTLLDLPSGVLMTYYMLAKYHERYRLTAWILGVLTERLFTPDQINETEEDMIKVYEDILNSDKL